MSSAFDELLKIHGVVVDERDEWKARAEKAEAELADIRERLGGHKYSVLSGPDGLAALTYAKWADWATAFEKVEDERDALKSRVTELEEILRQCDTCPTGGCTTKEPPCR